MLLELSCLTINLRRLKNAIRDDVELRIQINMLDIDVGSGVILNLTQTQVNRLKSLDRGRAARITLSRTQLKSMDDFSEVRRGSPKRDEVVEKLEDVTKKLVELTLTPSDVEKIKKVRFNDVPEVMGIRRRKYIWHYC